MHLFKKLTYLIGRQHYFCMNYYVDETAMEIPEKNIFTATEITTLQPMRGSNTFREFFRANAWTKSFLPNNYLRVSVAKDNSRGIGWLFEKIFNNRVGNYVDDMLMKITRQRWLNKTKKRKLNNQGVIMSMIAGKHVSKPDPTFFQKEFLGGYYKRVSEIRKKQSRSTLEINLNQNV